MATSSTPPALVIGAGMAGLAAALVLQQAGIPVKLFEQAAAFGEVGAGIQLGPNAMRVLQDWGLAEAVLAVAVQPTGLRVRSANGGQTLGVLTLGPDIQSRYGAPYATIHRADLHRLLWQRVNNGLEVHLQAALAGFVQDEHGVALSLAHGRVHRGAVLLGCDGLWSRTRAQLLADGPPSFSGDVAYRGLVPMADVAPGLRQREVSVWLAPGLHAVHYPVAAGTLLNVVVVVEGELPPETPGWDHVAQAQGLRARLGPGVHPDLMQILEAVPAWRLWPLMVRPPMSGPQQHAQGRVALLGDAAHPTRPYLAQGAAMAFEDAWALGQALGPNPPHWPGVLARMAAQRWQRNAWVQARSRRNGVVFHAQGPLRWGRDWAMRLGGERVLDMPFLYRGPHT